jgi:hypothetical protein
MEGFRAEGYLTSFFPYSLVLKSPPSLLITNYVGVARLKDVPTRTSTKWRSIDELRIIKSLVTALPTLQCFLAYDVGERANF